MRIVAREDDRLVGAHHLEYLHQVAAVVRLLDRLRTEVTVIEDVLARQFLEMWDFRFERRIHTVQPPHHVRCPADPALDEPEAEAWKFLEQPFADDTHT